MPNYPLSRDLYQRLFAEESNAFGDAYLKSRPDEMVPNCPEWNVAQLGAHIASIYHRIAELIRIVSLEPLDPKNFLSPTDPGEVLDHYREGAERLSVLFIDLDPMMPIWTFTGIRPALFWMRRMTHETMVHAFDLEEIHPPLHDPKAPAIADGIDEFFSAQLPGKISRKHVPGLNGRLALTATDSKDRWVIDLAPDRLDVVSENATADAELTGTARDLLMYLWRRGFAPALEKTGDLDLIMTYYRDVRL
ncbi:MAG TPA: maleylpyruvate isomerase family mycothiol-dependent enzyme [Acidimicrobiales bacterium]|nr:maleylpyruvate isomerase family mycothiol-dependent enzyme [Acidimicrobiales bacterium]